MYFYMEEGGTPIHRIWVHKVATWRILFPT